MDYTSCECKHFDASERHGMQKYIGQSMERFLPNREYFLALSSSQFADEFESFSHFSTSVRRGGQGVMAPPKIFARPIGLHVKVFQDLLLVPPK